MMNKIWALKKGRYRGGHHRQGQGPARKNLKGVPKEGRVVVEDGMVSATPATSRGKRTDIIQKEAPCTLLPARCRLSAQVQQGYHPLARRSWTAKRRSASAKHCGAEI